MTIMKCLNCSCGLTELRNVRFTPVVKNEGVDIVVPCSVCKGCNTPLMDGKQLNLLRRKAADRYRENNQLLTSQQIHRISEKIGNVPSVFAKFLNVGEASVKRWETYYIQDSSQNDHIRLKCDEAVSEFNYLDLHWRYLKPSFLTGGKKFSLDIVKHVENHFVKVLLDCCPYLQTLHFYSDFLHFKRFNMGLSGNKYIPYKCGPCPFRYKEICQLMGHHSKPNPLTIALKTMKRGQSIRFVRPL